MIIDDLIDEFGEAESHGNGFFSFREETNSYCDYMYCHAGERDTSAILTLSRDDDNLTEALELLLWAKSNNLVKCGYRKHLFSCGRFGFAISAPPTHHSLLEGRMDRWSDGIVYLFPCGNCEFSGHESSDLFKKIRMRYADVEKWDREIRPRIIVRFDNPRTGAGSVGNQGALFRWESLAVEIDALSGVSGGRIEITSFRDDTVTLTSASQGKYELSVDGNSIHSGSSGKRAKDLVLEFLTRD